MGGRGSGGQNKCHVTVEDYDRLDSFSFYRFLRSDKYLQYKDTVAYPGITKAIVYHAQTHTAEIFAGIHYRRLELSRVPGIDGKSSQLYFICPYCSTRVRYLYNANKRYVCRHCLKANYRIQQTYGMDKLHQQMIRIVEHDLQYSYWRLEHPGVSVEDLFLIPRPPYMRHEKYNRLIAHLRELQDEYIRLYNKILFRPSKWLSKWLSE